MNTPGSTGTRRGLAIALGATAIGALGVGLRAVRTRLDSRHSYSHILESFTYKLGQVSGICYGRLAVAADDRVDAAKAIELTRFDHEFEIRIELGNERARWVCATFRPSTIGVMDCRLTGDKDTLLRLARWLRHTVYSNITHVRIDVHHTVVTFLLDDTNFADVRAAIAMVDARDGTSTAGSPE